MNFRRDAQKDLAGCWDIGLLTEACAGLQIVVNRFMEGGLQFFDRRAVKTDDIAYSGQMTDKDPIIGIKLNAGGISFKFHGAHGVTPISSRKRLASATR